MKLDIKSAIMSCPRIFDESDIVRILSWRMSKKKANSCQRQIYEVLKEMTDAGEIKYHPKFAKYAYVTRIPLNNEEETNDES